MSPRAPLLLLASACAALLGCPATNGPCKTNDECPKGNACCGGKCTDVENDKENCGECGAVCALANAVPSCRTGRCQLMCESGWGNCNGLRDDGCEKSLAEDVTSCGLCGRTCTAVNGAPVCQAMQCKLGACTADFADCDGDDLNGCEIDTRTDSAHCSACDRPCALPHATSSCAASTCVIDACAADWGDCDTTASTGCEVNLTTDAANCGQCGKACGPGQTCIASRCRANELIVYGGAISFTTSSTTNQVFKFDLGSNTFTQLSPATPMGSPPARGRHVAAWDFPRNRMVIWGGVDGAGTPVPTDTWALDFSVVPPAWRRLTVTGTPPSPRFAPVAALDPQSSKLYLFGGTTELGAGLSDLHTLDLATGAWAQLHAGNAANAPGDRINAVGAFDPVNRVFMVFGGNHPLIFTDLGELWQYDVVAGAWKTPPITPTTGGPPARARGAFFDGSPVYLFSGVASLLQAPASMQDDLRTLDVAAATPWTNLFITGPAARFNAGFTPRDGLLYVFAGGATGPSGQSVFGDLWVFTPGTNQWARLHDGTGVVPVGRLAPTMVAR